MPTLRETLNAPFAEEELRHFEGRGGKTMTFIEDETVMDRLDDALGIGNWQVLVEAVPIYEGVVKVRLGIRDNGEWAWYEDFGYPNQAGGDVLKEAVSDGIRRCGRYLGIARDLYRKRTYEQTNGAGRVVPPARPARSSTDVPVEADLDWDVLSPKKPEPRVAAAIASHDPDGVMSTKELMDRAEAAHVPVKVLGDTAKRMYGQDSWKLTALTASQRYAVALEVGLA